MWLGLRDQAPFARANGAIVFQRVYHAHRHAQTASALPRPRVGC
ncbi:hypothetical protein AcetOrient_orf01870 [Acetobacter orientalis]|uniref:Uncharacterized protein n=1 Tax=Acetobacter orientalis TaxID=146474 RepID=A0A2Z5ZG95_9PROT|nr:hypothetical protein AcetOrient_orf01870 [Acetobacter orientalis]